MIYNMAAEQLKIDPQKCIVVEDSIVGLKAAKVIKLQITTS